jgi:hypothetical protein
MSGAMPLLFLYAFMAGKGITLSLPFTVIMHTHECIAVFGNCTDLSPNISSDNWLELYKLRQT